MRGRGGRGRGSFLGGGMMGMRAAPYGRGGRGGQVCDNCGQPGTWTATSLPFLRPWRAMIILISGAHFLDCLNPEPRH